jgi:hypothetical protein
MQLAPSDLLEARPQLGPDRDAIGLSATHVIHVPSGPVDPSRGEHERAHQVVDKQQIADLFPIAVNSQRCARGGREHEVRHPALVLGAELARPVNTRHAEHHGAQPVDASIVVHVLVRGALRAAVRRVEIQGFMFVDAVGCDLRVGKTKARFTFDRGSVWQRPVDFIGRRVQDGWRASGLAGPYGFEHVVRSQKVDIQVLAGIEHRLVTAVCAAK